MEAYKPIRWPLTHFKVDQTCLPSVTGNLTYKGKEKVEKCANKSPTLQKTTKQDETALIDFQTPPKHDYQSITSLQQFILIIINMKT